MKATSQSLAAVPSSERSWFAVYADLVKLRLTFLVLLTTAAGYYMGSTAAVDFPGMFYALLGTGLLACGASALNQLMERQPDARMRRTETRPLPAGRLQPDTVLIFGAVLCVAGLLELFLTVPVWTGLLGALTLGSYLFVYTPLKRVTWWNTAIGAIPGGLPPLMGWVAARQEVTWEGLCLFGILYLWQIPHFLAIAWLYRADYTNAGFVMLPQVDPTGTRTGRVALGHALALVAVSFGPVLLGMAGSLYLLGAAGLGALFLNATVRFSRHRTAGEARRVFYASILYLPLLLGLLALDKVKL